MTDTVNHQSETAAEMPAARIGQFAIGQLLASKYKVLSLLGSGGNGTVYHVRHVFLDQDFALKTLDGKGASETSVRRFQAEAQAARRLQHPNLVVVHDFGFLDEERPFLVMDLVDGSTLASRLEEVGMLAVDEAVPLFVQICLGLASAHAEKIVHRDIKPSNIMLVRGRVPGSEGSVKILDFGIAKFAATEGGEIQALTRTGEIFGSPLYMSPEQCSGGAIDQRSDIYSLGCVLFEALTGAPPHVGQSALATMMMHQAESPPSLREASLGKTFPEAIERIVAKMLSKSPPDRYQELVSVAHELSNLKTGAIAHKEPKPTGRKQDKVISMPAGRLYALLAAVSLTAAILSGAFGYFYRPPAAPRVLAVKAHEKAVHKQSDPDSEVITSWKEIMDHQSGPGGEDVAALARIDKIQSTRVVKDGVSYRRLVFPRQNIGRLFTFHDLFVKEVREAQGEVLVPAAGSLGWDVSGKSSVGVFLTPSLFEKMPAGLFQGLCLRGDYIIIKQHGQLDLMVPSANIEKIFSTVRGWKDLESILLASMPLSSGCLEQIDGVRRLTSLQVNECAVDLSHLARLPLLRRLKTLAIVGRAGQDGDQIVSRLSGAKSLRVLMLEHLQISAAAVEKLRSCSNLETLDILKPDFDDQTIAALTNLKGVKTLRLGGARLKRSQIEKLIGCGWLRHINVNAPDLDQQSRIELESKANGRLTISSEWKPVF